MEEVDQEVEERMPGEPRKQTVRGYGWSAATWALGYGATRGANEQSFEESLLVDLHRSAVINGKGVTEYRVQARG